MKLPLVIQTRGVPVLVWSSALGKDTRAQLVKLAEKPWALHHVAAMPDAHVSDRVAIGTVFATKDVIVPGALGTDLGCGVSAIRFDSPGDFEADQLEALLREWTRTIPTGDEQRRQPVDAGCLLETPLSTHELERARTRLLPRHLGTLGGGNHFIELDRAHDGSTWLLVHSGSRGLGGAIGDHHVRVAGGPLKALPLDTPLGAACWNDTAWALSFAKENRRALLNEALVAVHTVLGLRPVHDSLVDLHHNFASLEEHFGGRCVVHRKGAIHAAEGALGLIPGSMGTASYLVRGLGEPRAFSSASHGAGRVMTRTEARQRISRAHFERQLRGVTWDRSRPHLVEEAPSAYRDVVEVLEDEADLVTRELRLEPLVVLKG